MRVTFSRLTRQARQQAAGTLVLCLPEGGGPMLPSAHALDSASSGRLTRALAAAQFGGKAGQVCLLEAPEPFAARRLMVVGLGPAKHLTPLELQRAGGRVARRFGGARHGDLRLGALVIAADWVPGTSYGVADLAAHLAYGVRLGAYRYTRHMVRAERPQVPATLKVLVASPAPARRAYRRLASVAEGVALARDLVNEPSNVKTPLWLAGKAKALDAVGVDVRVLRRARLEKLGMGGLLAVASGSAQEPAVAVMRWRGRTAPQGGPDVAFVGKGVTFDTGGISIKPAAGMERMRDDMAGAAAVIGAMHALAARRAKVDAIGIVGLAENMVSGTACRPGDVIRTMSGRTVEVIDTDAEGRLVLADLLHFARVRFRPRRLIDLGTLTGAVVTALGAEHAGMFTRDDGLAESLSRAGAGVGELLWRLPLGPGYQAALKSDIADLRQCAPAGLAPDACHAARFLAHFAGALDDDRDEAVAWAHLDIAGVADRAEPADLGPKGATGFGVRLLDRFVADCCEG
ncbi:MAG: leucyl aminopeptidase [Acetobacterales bacterium]